METRVQSTAEEASKKEEASSEGACGLTLPHAYAKIHEKCNVSHTNGGTDHRPEPIKDGDCDRSQPISGPDPDSRVWETPVHTPQPHATPPQGSVQGEGSVRDSRTENEPVAWVAWFDDEDKPDADFLFSTKERADDWCCKRGADPVPLYRHPPCQDFSQKNLTLTDAEREAVRTAAGCMGMWMLENGVTEDESMRRSAATLRGLLERLGGVR